MSNEVRRGRRPIDDTAARRQIAVRLTDSQALQLKQVARQNGQTRAQFIRDAISEAVADCSDARVFRRR